MKYVVLLFPRASPSRLDEALRALGENMRIKRSGQFVPGTRSRAKALLKCIYGDKQWFDRKSAEKHTRKKYAGMYDQPVRFYVVKSSKGLKHVVRCKKRMRSIFGIGTSSVHINDYRSETRDLLKFLSKHRERSSGNPSET